MYNDKLHRKSISAIFMLMTFGVSLFFYTNKEVTTNSGETGNKQANNLASIEEQLQKQIPPELEGFDNLSEEAEKAGRLLPQTE